MLICLLTVKESSSKSSACLSHDSGLEDRESHDIPSLLDGPSGRETRVIPPRLCEIPRPVMARDEAGSRPRLAPLKATRIPLH